MRCRLGDDIDDFCVKCKRVMNHLVVSLLNDEPAKVRCRTCHNDHDFRHEQAPPPRVDARKAALIQQAMEKAAVATGNGAAAGADDPPPEEAAPAAQAEPAAKPARRSAKAK
jgi:hypothetical protein